jgi:hypothetical protein
MPQNHKHIGPNSNGCSAETVVQGIAQSLPSLPSNVRVLDDFTGELRSVVPIYDEWKLEIDGQYHILRFDKFTDPNCKTIIKSFFCWFLHNYDPSSMPYYRGYIGYIQTHGETDFLNRLFQEPWNVEKFYLDECLPYFRSQAHAVCIKVFLRWCCRSVLGYWKPEYESFVARWPLPFKDSSYRATRSGDVTISAQAEAALVRYFDGLNASTQHLADNVCDTELQRAVVLYWSYQHAFRPNQIAYATTADVTHREGLDGAPTIEVVFYRAKQRDGKAREPMRRAAKREWAPMIAEFLRRRHDRPLDFLEARARDKSLFGLTPYGVSLAIKALYVYVTQDERDGVATALRHSAGQRLADSGASVVEIAEYLGHSLTETAQVYFDATPTQADKINKALGLSPIYSALAQISREKRIDKEQLLGLKPDQQIGAMPHGIPVAGIGGCGSGQSLCSLNPGLSCYTCSKFMPLNEPDVHRNVRDGYRSVVRQFVGAGRDDEHSPAFMQLRRTLDAIELLVDDLNEDEAM